MYAIGDVSKFIDVGLDEPDYSTVFCECGEKKEIPVEFNNRWKTFVPCDKRDLTCYVCGSEMTF